jgi:hypothetical protein
MNQFLQFVALERLGDFRPNQWEVTYVNHIPQGTVWSTPSDWSFCRLLAAIPTIESLADGEDFTGEWHFRIPPDLGRLHVEWQHVKELDSGQQDKELIRLTLTARGPTLKGGDEVQSALDGLSLGRSIIVNCFKQFMTDEANTYWGLKDGDD